MILARAARLIAFLSVVPTVACSGSEDGNPGGSDGGQVGTGGVEGVGGVPGAGGYRFPDDPCGRKSSCITDCGLDNAFPEGLPRFDAEVDCSIMGFALPLQVAFAIGHAENPEAPDERRVSAQLTLPAETVDVLLEASCGFNLVGARVDVAWTGGSVSQSSLSPSPCIVCAYVGIPESVNLDPVAIPAEELSAEGTLEAITLVIDLQGLELEFTTEGDAPTCVIPTSPP